MPCNLESEALLILDSEGSYMKSFGSLKCRSSPVPSLIPGRGTGSRLRAGDASLLGETKHLASTRASNSLPRRRSLGSSRNLRPKERLLEEDCEMSSEEDGVTGPKSVCVGG